MIQPAMICLFTIVLVTYLVTAEIYLQDTFPDELPTGWVQSKWKGDESGTFDVHAGNWTPDPEITRGLRITEPNKFYAISKKFKVPFTNKDKDLIIQYVVKNENANLDLCVGGYVKLLPADVDQENFKGDSPYYIMFGPDSCGNKNRKIHLIFSKNGEPVLKDPFIHNVIDQADKYSHTYTLVISPDNTYTVSVDHSILIRASIASGNWSNIEPLEIPDETDIKPDDWQDDEFIPDENAIKPDDWDDDIPAKIPKPDATKPKEWDNEEDGEWEPPMIDNPEYRGKWTPPMISNPLFKGEWEPRKVPNPKYDPDAYVYSNIGAIGIEVWAVEAGTIFSNIIVTDSMEEAKKIGNRTSYDFTKRESEYYKELFGVSSNEDESEHSEDDVEQNGEENNMPQVEDDMSNEENEEL